MAIFAVACAPTATSDVEYADVDEAFLDKSVVVLATSPVNNVFTRRGWTLFVDESGAVRKIKNGGIFDAKLAYEPGRLGFSDVNHDYILGRDPIVSERGKAEDFVLDNFFIGGDLLTVFTSYEMALSRTSQPSKVEKISGNVSAVAQCGEDIWAFIDSDFDGEEILPIVEVRRIEPSSDETWILETEDEYVNVTTASCDGNILTAYGETYSDEQEFTNVVMHIDITTGEGAIIPLGEYPGLPNMDLLDAEVDVLGLRGSTMYVLAWNWVEGAPVNELVRIDVRTGAISIVSALDIRGNDWEMIRTQGDVFYVLSVQRNKPSVVQAFRLMDGRSLGSFEFDSVSDVVSEPGVLPFPHQEISDFVVLNPDVVLTRGVPDSV